MLFSKIWELPDGLFCHFLQKRSTSLDVLKGFCKKAKLALLLFYWVALTQFCMHWKLKVCANLPTYYTDENEVHVVIFMKKNTYLKKFGFIKWISHEYGIFLPKRVAIFFPASVPSSASWSSVALFFLTQVSPRFSLSI